MIVPAINGTMRAFSESVKKAGQEIDSRRKVEEDLREAHDELKERVKELNCLYRISRLLEDRGISPEETLQRIANIIPASLQYPDIACARIQVHDREYRTANFREPVSKQSHSIIAGGNTVGVLEVGYVEERATCFEGPFLQEEKTLINAIAESVGKIVASKEAEEALLRSQELLAEAQRIAKIGNWEWDSRTNQVSWSAEIYRIFGVRPEEFKPDYRRHLEFIPAEDVEGYEQTIQDCLASRQPFAYESRVATPAGEIKTIWVHGYVKLDDRGNSIGMRGTAQDITERKRIEVDLRTSREQLNAIFKASPAAILLVNPDGLITFANERMGELFSRACSSLQGTPYIDLGPSGRAIRRLFHNEGIDGGGNG